MMLPGISPQVALPGIWGNPQVAKTWYMESEVLSTVVDNKHFSFIYCQGPNTFVSKVRIPD